MLFESSQRIEPCFLEQLSPEIGDLIATLIRRATQLGERLHPRTAESLAGLVRIMNCYYSNLIEGHNTSLRDIENALADDLAATEQRRNLQLEARSHIQVQQYIDICYSQGQLPEPASQDFIIDLHRRFYAEATPAMLRVEGAKRQFDMVPGVFRSVPEHDVSVGRHVPPSSHQVPAFMQYFAKRYLLSPLGEGQRLIAMAAAHHRFNFIHPFPDGNGRVSRLMSHAMALWAGVGAHGLWSISRGLARGLEDHFDYKRMMDHADMPRQGDLDGRGNLSLRALNDYIVWFFRVCIDQINFMSELFQLQQLSDRLLRYVDQQNLRPESRYIVLEVLRRGELSRGEAARVSGLKERTARGLLAGLVNNGILASKTPKGPVSLHFSRHAVEVLFPALYVGRYD